MRLDGFLDIFWRIHVTSLSIEVERDQEKSEDAWVLKGPSLGARSQSLRPVPTHVLDVRFSG